MYPNNKIKQQKQGFWGSICFYACVCCGLLGCVGTPTIFAASIIPTGSLSNRLYYQVGGGSDYTLPPVPYATPINLSAKADLGLGNQCGMYNPALSITNTLNDLSDSVNNLTQNLIASATGSLSEMPMYFLAQANPTLYNLLTSSLINAHALIDASVKSCQETRSQIAQGQNPYQDWGTISVGDAWKQHLSLTAAGSEDVNEAETTITQTAGDHGVPWVQGQTDSDGITRAGGKNQPPVHTVADAVKAGYNALLDRDLTNEQPAPSNSELASTFATPQAAADWVTTVVGDQIITTCLDTSCQKAQGSVTGRGLLPWMTVCNVDNTEDCVETLQGRLQDLVTGKTALTADHIWAVSAPDLAVSPEVIRALQRMDATQQGIFIHKLAQDVSMQRLLNKALTAHDLLQAGRQVPVIAANRPAQRILQDKIKQLDDDLQSLSFTSHVRQQMLSNTVTNILADADRRQQSAFQSGAVHNEEPWLQDSALPNTEAPTS